MTPDLEMKNPPPNSVVTIRTFRGADSGTEFGGIELILKLSIILAILVFCMILLMNFGSGGYQLQHFKHTNSLLGLFCSGLIALAVGFVLNNQKSERDNELKIIDCSFNGIRLGTGKFDLERSFFISWNRVNIVEALKDKRSSDHYLILCTIDRKLYQIKWQNAFSWIDEESFFSTVKSSASHAKFNWDIDELKGKDKLDTRYTNLWLHYFSAPSTRTRRGRLENGVRLQDGEYKIIKPLGGGGQGMAYLASSLSGAPDGSNLVVLKEYILPVYRGNSLESQNYSRLSSEAEILSAIDHPQIVKLFDCFIEDHRGYMVMEYIEGVSLNQRVKMSGPVKPLEVAEIGLSILEIFKHLHGQMTPIVHRDLTPDNLIATEDGIVKLLDFTVAHQEDGKKQRTATVVGKQAYIPPEQFRGQPVPQSDIYSLGCTMYYLLTGSDPKPMDVESASSVVPDLDPELDRIILKAAAFDLKDRYRDSDEMSAELGKWLSRLQ